MTQDRSTRLTKSLADEAQGDDCSLDRFERNQYFHGKLMTARDMAADQRYHRDRQQAQARHVGGTGAVCGLNVTVTDADEGGVSVRVGTGYAVDGCGNPIVVDNEFSETFGSGTIDSDERVAIWITYAECDLESVPVRGAENARGDECAFNRVLEISEIQCQNYDEDRNYGKGVPNVRFPTKGDLSSHSSDGPLSPIDPGLATIANSFTAADDGGAVDCSQGDGTVFLGVYEHDEGKESWSQVPDGAPRERVYTNDMLYAATARHTADFANPHQSSLAVESADSGAAVHVEDDRSGDADVTVTSSDSVLTVNVDGEAQEIDITAGAALEKLIETRIAPMEQYIMDKSMKYTYRIFSGVASTYGTETGGEIAEKTKTGVDEREYASKQQYHTYIEEIHELEAELVDELSGQVTKETMSRYEAAVDRLGNVLKRVEDKGVLALAVAQDEVVEAADWLEQPDMPPIEIPGTTLPGGSILPTDPLTPIDPSKFPETGGGDGDDGGGEMPITPTPIDPTQPTLPNQPTIPSQPTIPTQPTVPTQPSLPTQPTTPTAPTAPTGGTSGGTPSGGTPVTMPNLTGQTTETAQNVLKNSGVQPTVTIQPVEDSTSLQGTGVNEVSEQSPAPGNPVNPGDQATVTVNQPPAVTRVEGIGDVTASTLKEQGIESVGDVATASTSTLTEAGLSTSTAEAAKSQAQTYAEAHQLTKVEGIGTDEAEALADAANVTTISDLRATPNEQIKETAKAAAESGTVSQETAETVQNMNLEAATQNANSVAVQSQPVSRTKSEGGGDTATDTGGDTQQAGGTAGTMPDLTGQTTETAQQTLANAGVQTTVETEPVEDPKSLAGAGVNEVSEQSPAPGDPVNSGDQATVTVNQPPAVTRTKGVGESTAASLADHGIQTVGQLATTDPSSVAENTDISESKAAEIQASAEKYASAHQLTKIPEIGAEEAEALADAANVTSTQNLKNTSNESIQTATTAAQESATIAKETAETVQNINMDTVKKNLTNLGL
ncbi:MAG: PASTA domain-containing protein [Haloarcula sp.]